MPYSAQIREVERKIDELNMALTRIEQSISHCAHLQSHVSPVSSRAHLAVAGSVSDHARKIIPLAVQADSELGRTAASLSLAANQISQEIRKLKEELKQLQALQRAAQERQRKS